MLAVEFGQPPLTDSYGSDRDPSDGPLVCSASMSPRLAILRPRSRASSSPVALVAALLVYAPATPLTPDPRPGRAPARAVAASPSPTADLSPTPTPSPADRQSRRRARLRDPGSSRAGRIGRDPKLRRRPRSPAADGRRVLGGGTIDLAALKGKPVWVNFMATYCPPCRRRVPAHERLRGPLRRRRAS